MEKESAKDFTREKLKTWIGLHGARRSGIVWLKNKMMIPRHHAAHQKGSQNSLPLTGGTSSSNLEDEVLSLDNPFAMFTDACF